MHYKLLHPNEYIAAHDLRGKDVVLTIRALKSEGLRTEKGEEDRWIVYFEEMAERCRRDRKAVDKRMVLNKTNATTIAKVHGVETEGWVGKRIALFATTCQAFGSTVDCIRIRDRAPKAAGNAPDEQPDPAPDDDGLGTGFD